MAKKRKVRRVSRVLARKTPKRKKGPGIKAQKKLLKPFFRLRGKKGLKKAMRVFKAAERAGRIHFPATGRKLRLLQAYFNLENVPGAKGAFLTRKFAGKKLKWDGDMPIFRGQGVEMRFYPAPDLNIFEDETGDPSDLEAYHEYLRQEITAFVRDLPKGYIFQIVFGGFDYLKGAPNSPDKQALIDELLELLAKVVSSKPEIIHYFEGILAVKKIRNKRRGKAKKKIKKHKKAHVRNRLRN